MPRSFFRRDAVTVARALLGQRLVTCVDGLRTAGIIVETEAYLGVIDEAAHTYGGRRTVRNESMWGDAGHAYVYFVYGMHHCVNVVAGGPDDPVAVLIRALEPEEGIEAMFARRGAARRSTDLCSGPARLAQALSVDRSLDGLDLRRSDELFLEALRNRALPDAAVARTARIGVAYAGAWARRKLRFHIKGNPHVSGPRRAGRPKRGPVTGRG